MLDSFPYAGITLIRSVKGRRPPASQSRRTPLTSLELIQPYGHAVSLSSSRTAPKSRVDRRDQRRASF